MKRILGFRLMVTELMIFAKSHKKFLVVELLVTIVSLILVGFLADRIFFSIIFAKDPEVRKIMIIEHFDGGMSNISLSATLVLVTLAFYMYLLFIEPALIRKKMNSENFSQLHQKLENRIGMNLLYLIFMVFIINACNATARNYGELKDISGYMEDIRLYREGELEVTHGTARISSSPKNLENDTKITPKRGIVYLDYIDDVYEKSVCLRCSPQLYNKRDNDNAYVYSITYLPYSKIVVDIEVYGRIEDNAANTLPGYEILTQQEKNLLRIMMDDKLGEISMKSQENNIVYPYYFSEGKVYREAFDKLNNMYKTYYYEYKDMPYRYDVYGTDTGNNLLAIGDPIYTNYYHKEYVSIDQREYFQMYRERLDKIVDEMPKNLGDKEKVLYLTQYMLDHCKPLRNEEILEEESFETVYFCNSGYGAILSGTGNAVAYAQSLYGLLKRAGVEVIPVRYSKSGYGICMVKLEGQWYFVDGYTADYLSSNVAVLFTDQEFDSLYKNDIEYSDFRYGYTDQEIPACADKRIEVSMIFREGEGLTEKETETLNYLFSMENYDGICNVVTKAEESQAASSSNIRYSKNGIPLKGEDISKELEEFILYVFKHAQTYRSENGLEDEEMLVYEYGKEANSLGQDLFRYLCYEGTKSQDASLVAQTKKGYFGNQAGFGNKHLMANYEMMTGLSPESVFTDAHYEMPDDTAIYIYDETWDVCMQTGKKEYVDKSGGEKYPGNVSRNLYPYPLRVEVEQIEKDGDLYHIVFYTTYTDYGDYYFNMDVRVNDNNDMTILFIKSRY